jgi:hypothetical protein
MQSNRFRLLLDTPGPFASVYFPDSDDSDDVAAQAGQRWPELREQLRQQGAQASVVNDIEHAVTQLRPPTRRGGRAVVAGATGVVLNEYLHRPAAEPVVRVSELPYIVPILEHGFEHLHYLLVVVDPTGALITTHNAVVRRSETVAAGDCWPDETSGIYADGDPKRCVIADRVSELASDESFGTMFLVGDVRLRSNLLAALPAKLRKLATPLPVRVRRGGYDFEEIQRAIDTTMLRQRLNLVDNVTERFTAEIGRRSGLATEGLGAVCSALRHATIDTMIIGEIDDATVVVDAGMTTVAPNADVLSEQGAAPARTLRADEALPLLAISVGASLVRTDERIAPADGIGAVLRHAPH